MDEADLRVGEEEDSRLARILADIANQVTVGIEMVADFPTNNHDSKMAILDTKVWKCPDQGLIMYKHYEKSVSNRDVLHAHSAQSATCKKNVHVQEVLRRMLNTSTSLNWEEYGAPVVSDYMLRMKNAQYDEVYRKNTLKHASRIYQKKLEESATGIRPLYREKQWKRVEQKKEKKEKKKNWSKL